MSQTCVLPDGQVAFRCCAPSGSSVFVAGNFNDWNPTGYDLQQRRDGIFEKIITLPRGVHVYKMVVNGSWMIDMTSVDSTLYSDGLGGYNSVINNTTAAQKVVVDTISYSDCSQVTFRVYAETRPGECIFLCGDTWGLGNFTPNKGVELFTDPDSYPVWSTKQPVILSAFVPIRYRYALFSAGKFKSWDSAGTRIRRAACMDYTITDIFSNTDSSTLSRVISKPQLNAGLSLRPRIFSQSHDDLVEKRSRAVQAEITKAKHEMELNLKTSSLYIVHFRLPITLNKLSTGKWNVDWDPDSIIAKTDGSISSDMLTTWVGTLHYTYPQDGADPFDPREREGVIAACAEKNCVPIFIEDKSLVDDFYRGYVKCVLYPSFHNVMEVYDDCFTTVSENEYIRIGYDDEKLDRWFRAYVKVNEAFADTLLSLSTASLLATKNPPTLWVHGYHLMLVPRLIQEQMMFNIILHNGKSVNSNLRKSESEEEGSKYFTMVRMSSTFIFKVVIINILFPSAYS
jgi:hypothetical protein